MWIAWGIFDTDVKRFISQRHEDKVPRMGWNTIARINSGLFKGFTKEEFVYFVHSFYVPVSDCTAAVTDYIHPFSALCIKTITTPHSSIRKEWKCGRAYFAEFPGTVNRQIVNKNDRTDSRY